MSESRATESRGWCSFFFRTKCVCVTCSLQVRVSLSPWNIHVFRALVYSLPVFIPGQFFFVCEHPQIHSSRRIILLIRYSHFYAPRTFPIDYRYFNDVNNIQNFNNYLSGIYLDSAVTQFFNYSSKSKIFCRHVKTSFSVLFCEKSFV